MHENTPHKTATDMHAIVSASTAVVVLSCEVKYVTKLGIIVKFLPN